MADNKNPDTKPPATNNNSTNTNPNQGTNSNQEQDQLLTLPELVKQTGESQFVIVGALVEAGLQKKMENNEPLISLTNFKAKLEEFKGKEIGKSK